MRITELLESAAHQHPGDIAVSSQTRRITYRDLWLTTTIVAKSISELKLKTGTRAAILYENSIEYVIIYFAILKAGLIVVPLDTSAGPESLSFILSNCEVQLLFVQQRFLDRLTKVMAGNSSLEIIIAEESANLPANKARILAWHEVVGESEQRGNASSGPTEFEVPPHLTTERNGVAHELAAIFYTSGSTGTPKGVMLSHRNLITNTWATVDYLKLTSTDSVLVILPFFYIYGNSLLLTHIAVGGRLVIDNRFMYPEVILDTMESERVTGLSGVPSNFMILLNKSTLAKRKLNDLRYFTQAGGAMAPEIIKRLIKACPTKEIYVMYGLTEAAPRVTYLPPNRLVDKVGSIGIPLKGVRVVIADDDGTEVAPGDTGELTVVGDNVMMGYWDQPDEEKTVLREGVLFTGDLALRDRDGFIFIVGRKKEIIKTGGNRVSAKEVEECILKNDNVSEACVFGVKDEILGEAIKAVVVPKTGAKLTPQEVQGYCRRKLANFKVPKHVVFVEGLPKHLSGKINKQAVKEISQ
jgi:acyl-CoA synthetase (AMP-forming)/AMP-acid ligase II